VKAYGIGYILRRQVCKKWFLHHEKVGCPSAPNPIVARARSEDISVAMVVVQGGFGGCSFQGQRWEIYMDLCVGLGRKGR
jgi:hypothetical protein